MKLSPDRLLAGILEPVFAIRTENDLGIGDTDGVRQMIDWCARLGLGVFQTLPINETSDDNSPYNSISSLAIEPATIAISPKLIPDLTATQFKQIAQPKLRAELRAGAVNYPKVKALKHALLHAAFTNFLGRHFNRDTARAKQFRAFLMENADWLSDYALFRVLMEENGHTPGWENWHVEHRGPRRARTWLVSLPERTRDALMRRQLYFMYVQWVAFSQWQVIKAYGESKGVFLMGDIPFGVGRASADAWANRSIFDLDWSGGAPPEWTFRGDPFVEKWGQNWGIPIYRWDELRRHDFEWWRTRVRTIQQVFHLYRIDHVLGFFRIYSFPWPPSKNAQFVRLSETEAADLTRGRLPGFKPFPDDTHEHRAANQAQGEEILRVVQEASGETAVIAEDLGCVPDYVPAALAKLGIPGFRIPLFFREHDGRYSDPKHYPRLSLAQPATHDHPPLAAFWQELWQKIDAGHDVENARREQRHLMNFAGLASEETPRELTDHVLAGFTRAVMQGNSWLVVFQITDIFAQTERFNVPGSTSTSNWSHRLPQTVKQLEKDPTFRAKAELFARLAQEGGRTT